MAFVDRQTPAEFSLRFFFFFLPSPGTIRFWASLKRERSEVLSSAAGEILFIQTTLSFLYQMQSRFDGFGFERESLSVSVIK